MLPLHMIYLFRIVNVLISDMGHTLLSHSFPSPLLITLYRMLSRFTYITTPNAPIASRNQLVCLVITTPLRYTGIAGSKLTEPDIQPGVFVSTR